MADSFRAANAERQLRRIGYWLVLCLALTLPNLTRPTNVLALLLLFVVAGRLLLRRLPRPFDRYDIAVAGLAAASALSTLFGLPGSGMQGLAESASMLAAFLAIRHGGLDTLQLKRLALLIVAGAVIAAIAAVGTYLLGKDFLVRFPAMPGLIRSSLYAGIALLLCLGLIIAARPGWSRLALVPAAVVLGLAVLAMASRGVALAVIAALAVALALRYRWRMLLPTLGILGIALLAASLLPDSIRTRIGHKTEEMAALVVSGAVSDNDQARIEIWRVSLAWIRGGEHWLFGLGPRNFHRIDAGQLALDAPLRFPEVSRHPAHAHNMFATKYVEEGIVGLSAMLALFGLVGWRLVRHAREHCRHWPWWGAWGGLLLPVANGMIGSPWFREYAWLGVVTFAVYLAWPTAGREQAQV